MTGGVACLRPDLFLSLHSLDKQIAKERTGQEGWLATVLTCSFALHSLDKQIAKERTGQEG
jgi:hypothetical protein